MEPTEQILPTEKTERRDQIIKGKTELQDVESKIDILNDQIKRTPKGKDQKLLVRERKELQTQKRNLLKEPVESLIKEIDTKINEVSTVEEAEGLMQAIKEEMGRSEINRLPGELANLNQKFTQTVEKKNQLRQAEISKLTDTKPPTKEVEAEQDKLNTAQEVLEKQFTDQDIENKPIHQILNRDVGIREVLEKSNISSEELNQILSVIDDTRDGVFTNEKGEGLQGRRALDKSGKELFFLKSKGVIKDFSMASLDVVNLGGKNADLGHEKANKVLKQLRLILDKHIATIEDETVLDKPGGDELAVLSVTSKKKLKKAIDTADMEIAEYIKNTSVMGLDGKMHKLSEILHPKHDNLQTGAGYITYDIIDASDVKNAQNWSDIASDVDKKAELRKEENIARIAKEKGYIYTDKKWIKSERRQPDGKIERKPTRTDGLGQRSKAKKVGQRDATRIQTDSKQDTDTDGKKTINERRKEEKTTVETTTAKTDREGLESKTPEKTIDQRRGEETFLKKTKKDYKAIREAEKEKIKKRGTRLYTGIPIDQLTPEIKIGATYIAEGIIDFKAWSKQMINDFGKGIKPHLKKIYDAAKISHEPKKTDKTPSREELDTEYKKVIKKKGLKEKTKDILRSFKKYDFKNFLDAGFGVTSTRMYNIDPSLKAAIRNHQYSVENLENIYNEQVKPFLDKKKKMSKDDVKIYDLAEKNRDIAKITELNKKYNLEESYKAKQKLLDNLYQRAKDSGIPVGYISNYAPRIVKDYDGLIKKLKGKEEWSEVEKSIAEKQKKQKTALTQEQVVEVIDSFYSGNRRNGKPRMFKGRRIDLVTAELNKYYETSDQSLLTYITAVNSALAERAFFGKSVEKSEDGKIDLGLSIGNYTHDLYMDGKIDNKQEARLKNMLEAYFNPGHMGPVFSLYRNLAYTVTIGQFNSTITQLGDMAFSLAFEGPINTIQGLARRNRIGPKDINIFKIAQEFSSPSKSAKVLDTVLRLSGFSVLDKLGKTSLINGALMRYSKIAKKPEKLKKNIEFDFGPIFKDSEYKQLVKDLREKKVSDNVKLLLFNEVLEFQPVAQTEMTEIYSKSAKARLLYQLKTYSIKLLDVYRHKIIRKMRTPGMRVEGFWELVKLTGALIALESTGDEIKDWLLGRKTTLKDQVIENLLKIVMLSKFTLRTAEQRGVGDAFLSLVTPTVSFLNHIGKDISKIAKNEKGKEFIIKEAETLQDFPLVGKYYYRWFGKGKSKNRKKKSSRSRSLSSRRESR